MREKLARWKWENLEEETEKSEVLEEKPECWKGIGWSVRVKKAAANVSLYTCINI